MKPDEGTPLVEKEDKAALEDVWQSKMLWWAKMVLPVFVLLVVGTVFLKCETDWQLVTCAYVMAQIVTTVGYGDFAMDGHSRLAKIFMAFFAMASLVVLAYVIGLVGETLANMKVGALRRHLRKLQIAMTNVTNHEEAADRFGSINETISIIAPGVFFVFLGTVVYIFLEPCTCGYGLQHIKGCDGTTLETCKATGGVVKDFTECFYMSIITLTTVGFGDSTPLTELGRAIAIPWMLCGVIIFGNCLGRVSSLFYESETSSKMTAIDAVRSISKKTFDKIDKNGNGYLDKGEFVAYTLLKYDMVSEELIDEIFRQYNEFEGSEQKRVTFATITARQAALSANDV